MSQQREDLRHLMLAGTISFPSTFPNLAVLSLEKRPDLAEIAGTLSSQFLIATEERSISLTMKRGIPVSNVRAVFVPRDCRQVSFDDGMWYLGSEVEPALTFHLRNRDHVKGIVYVAEATATLLEVRAGMTAAESAQYYPPIACDRSRNHYNPNSASVTTQSVSPQIPPGKLGGAYSLGPLDECEGVKSSAPPPIRRLECEQFQSPDLQTRRFECEQLQTPIQPYRRLECEQLNRGGPMQTTRSERATPYGAASEDVINPHDPHLESFKGKQWYQ